MADVYKFSTGCQGFEHICIFSVLTFVMLECLTTAIHNIRTGAVLVETQAVYIIKD